MKKLLLVLASSALLLSACGGNNGGSSSNPREAEKREEMKVFEKLDDKEKTKEVCDQLAGYLEPVFTALNGAKGLKVEAEVTSDVNFNLNMKNTYKNGDFNENKINLNVNSLSVKSTMAVGGFSLAEIDKLDLTKLVALAKFETNGSAKYNMTNKSSYDGKTDEHGDNLDLNLNGLSAGAYLSNSVAYVDLSNQNLRSLFSKNAPSEELKEAWEKTQPQFKTTVPLSEIPMDAIKESDAYKTIVGLLPMLQSMNKENISTLLQGILPNLQPAKQSEEPNIFNTIREYIDLLGVKFYTYPSDSAKNFTVEVGIKSFDDLEKIYDVVSGLFLKGNNSSLKLFEEQKQTLKELLAEQGVTLSTVQLYLDLDIMKNGALGLELFENVNGNIDHKESDEYYSNETKGSISSKSDVKLTVSFLSTDLANELPNNLSSYPEVSEDTLSFIQMLISGAGQVIPQGE